MARPTLDRPRSGDAQHSWTKRLSRTISSTLDLLFPPSCAVCRREGRLLCQGCVDALPRLEEPYCSLCAGTGGAPLCTMCVAAPPAYDGIRAPFLMEGAVREMVYGLKYRNLRSSALELGRLMAAHLESAHLGADLLIPVPLHRRRERERGYNQSGLLARELGVLTDIPVSARALRRTRNTPP